MSGGSLALFWVKHKAWSLVSGSFSRSAATGGSSWPPRSFSLVTSADFTADPECLCDHLFAAKANEAQSRTLRSVKRPFPHSSSSCLESVYVFFFYLVFSTVNIKRWPFIFCYRHGYGGSVHDTEVWAGLNRTFYPAAEENKLTGTILCAINKNFEQI